MRIGIDLDLTVIQSDEAWYNWLYYMCIGHEPPPSAFANFIGEMLKREGTVSYNLAEYFPEPTDGKSDAFNFFRGTTCYDTIKPVQGAVKTIKQLHALGHEIVFISHVKGNTLKSKHNWLLRHFPFEFGYIATKEKHLVNVDMIADDRLENLVNFPATVHKLLYTTPYKQTYNLVTRDQVIHKVDSWKGILEYVEKVTQEQDVRAFKAAHGVFD
jgi:5'(3')-deoxyribonucleotidase